MQRQHTQRLNQNCNTHADSSSNVNYNTSVDHVHVTSLFVPNVGDLYYVSCSVGNIGTNALIDTGAQLSLISDNFLAQLQSVSPNCKTISGNLSVNSVAQQPLSILGYVNLPLVIGNVRMIQQFAVAKNLAFSCIIGTDLLCKN